jgi:hypothetical protein
MLQPGLRIAIGRRVSSYHSWMRFAYNQSLITDHSPVATAGTESERLALSVLATPSSLHQPAFGYLFH